MINLQKREDKIIRAAKETARSKGIPFEKGHEDMLRDSLKEMVEGLPPVLVEYLPKDHVIFLTGDPDAGKGIVTETIITERDVLYNVSMGMEEKRCYSSEIVPPEV